MGIGERKMKMSTHTHKKKKGEEIQIEKGREFLPCRRNTGGFRVQLLFILRAVVVVSVETRKRKEKEKTKQKQFGWSTSRPST